MPSESPRIPARARSAWLGLAFLLAACLQEGGFQSPSDQRTLAPLGEYMGTVYGGDTAAVGRILSQARNPRLAVMWRSVGMRDDFTAGQSSVELDLPLTLRISLLQPPPPQVVRAREITFGLLTLFMDANGNGLFDRAMHPDFAPAYDRLDSLLGLAEAAQAALLEVSETRPRRTVCETLYLDAAMRLIAKRGDAQDTLLRMGPMDWDPSSDLPLPLPEYPRLLGRQNRWERFFAQRKKDNEFYRRSFFAPGWFRAVEVRYDREIWPKPGREDEFAQRMQRAMTAHYLGGWQSLRNYADFAASGKMEYPFQGYAEPGQDWIAGRAITDLLLFVPDQAALDTLRRALPGSTFRVEHSERVRVGYNLFHCDDQYVCSVKAPGDTVLVLAGSTEEFFNAPSTRVRNAFPDAVVQKPPVIPVSVLARMEGAYALNGSDTLAVAIRGGKAWCWFPGEGLRRVLPADSNGFQNPQSDAQGVFTPGLWGDPDRIIQYAGSRRNAYQRISAAVPPRVSESIDRIEAAVPFHAADSALDRYPGAYLFGADTLRVARTEGDSLAVTLKGYRNLVFHPASDTAFVSQWGDWTLEFPGCEAGACPSLVFGNGTLKKTVPAAGDFPSNRLHSSQAPAEGPLWGPPQGGTGPDDFAGLQGRGRYGCSQDGTFLRPGDGMLEGFDRAQPGDAVSLNEGGDAALFRIVGMRGKLAALELRDCAGKDAKGKRIWVSVWGGTDPSRLAPLPGARGWLAASAAGAYWTVDSIAVDSDPYFLRLVEEDTRDTPFFNAFDGYRLGEIP